MSLPDLSLLAHGVAPTAPPAEAYVATAGLFQWLTATEEVLGRIVHTVPDGAPEGTQPKPPYVPPAGNLFFRDRIKHLITYLETNFSYPDFSQLVPLSEQDKIKQITTFLETTEPFSEVFWPHLHEIKKQYADKSFPGFYNESKEIESSLATL